MGIRHWAAALVLAAMPAWAQSANGVTSGDFIVERPTLLSLGFEWKISGDANRNASVAVTWRKKGEPAWHKGLPLFRMGGEYIAGPKPQFGPNYYRYTVPPAFAGSVLNLAPDTEYEVHFVMSDPDGVTGASVQDATVRTRKVPAPAAGLQNIDRRA